MRVRSEWERQKLVILAFPHQDTDWARSGELQKYYAPFVRISQAIAYSEPVYILCRDKEEISNLFCSKNNMTFIEIDYNDTWVRDYGPISAEDSDGNAILLDFIFDGWGGKFEASLDNEVNRKLSQKGYFGVTPLKSIDFVLEGGSIESDGDGTILTTSKCLLNPNRNGGLSKEEVEERLFKYLGAKRVLWLDYGFLEGDDTDSHIDMLARFVNEDTIAYIECKDESDIHYEELNRMKEQLKSFKTKSGKPYNLVPLPMVEPKYSKDGNRLPASYANFLITNDALLFPTYESKRDKEAQEIFKSLFPNREIIPIPSLRLIEQGGSLHCSTMQVFY